MGRIFRLVIYLTRRMSPVIARASVFTFRAMLYALVTVLIGLPRAVTFIADDWRQRAIDNGFPSRWENLLYYILCAMAFLQFLLGWIVLSHVTVWLFRWIVW